MMDSVNDWVPDRHLTVTWINVSPVFYAHMLPKLNRLMMPQPFVKHDIMHWYKSIYSSVLLSVILLEMCSFETMPSYSVCVRACLPACLRACVNNRVTPANTPANDAKHMVSTGTWIIFGGDIAISHIWPWKFKVKVTIKSPRTWPRSIPLIIKKKNKQPKYVKMNNANEESFQIFCEEIKDTMKNMNWNTNLFHDPDHNYGIFERIISDAKAKHLAPRIVKFNRYKHKISPWATSRILRSIKYRDKLYKKLKLIPLILRYTIHWNTTWIHTVVFLIKQSDKWKLIITHANLIKANRISGILGVWLRKYWTNAKTRWIFQITLQLKAKL